MKAISVLDLKPGQVFVFDKALMPKGEFEILAHREDGVWIESTDDHSRWVIPRMEAWELTVMLVEANDRIVPVAPASPAETPKSATTESANPLAAA